MADPKVKFKRSSVQGKIPTVSDLPLGEIAINTYDGIIYTAKSEDGGISTSIVNVSGVRLFDEDVLVGFANTINFKGAGIEASVQNGIGIVTVSSTGGGDSYWSPSATGIHTSSNVGIGTTNATSKLTVDGNALITGIITATSLVKSGGTSSQFLKADGTVDSSTYYSSGGTDVTLADGGTNASLTASNGGIVYSTASAMAILSGTATAGQMLRSGANSAPSWSTATFPSTATSTGTILRANGTNWVATTATYPTTTTQNRILYSSAANTIGEITSANTSALVTSSSGVPSFTSGTTANRLLRTDGTTVSFAQANLTTDVTGTLPIANGGTNFTSTPTNGGISYGTGSAFAFTTAGTSGQVLTSAGAAAPTWSSNLNLAGIVTATDFNSTSDITLKTNIQSIKNPLEKITQIDGVSFNWKENNKPSIGVIAQQIENILPELVSDSGKNKTVNYNGIIGLLIECVKEQQIQINALSEQIETLKS